MVVEQRKIPDQGPSTGGEARWANTCDSSLQQDESYQTASSVILSPEEVQFFIGVYLEWKRPQISALKFVFGLQAVFTMFIIGNYIDFHCEQAKVPIFYFMESNVNSVEEWTASTIKTS